MGVLEVVDAGEVSELVRLHMPNYKLLSTVAPSLEWLVVSLAAILVIAVV